MTGSRAWAITLSADIIQAIDKIRGRSKNRSAFIEAALRDYLSRRAKKSSGSKDLEILDKHSSQLNREALDVLSYQERL